MRPSRGMGDMNPQKVKKITRKDSPNKVDVYKKGGKIKSVDRLEKQSKGADRVGKRSKAAENFGNLSKYYRGN